MTPSCPTPRSSDVLVAALFDDLLARYRAAIAQALGRRDDARALLDGFVQAHIGWAVANPAAARFLAGHRRDPAVAQDEARLQRSEEHTSELQSQMRISYAVFCLTKTKINYE